MKKRFVATLAASLVGLVLFSSTDTDRLLNRYPNSATVGAGQVELNVFNERSLSRQATYQTGDELLAVRRWYAVLLQINPASDINYAPAGRCAWLSQSKLVLLVEHTVSVLLCEAPHGTRIVVNETIFIRP